MDHDLLDQLRALHADLWDDEVGMVRMAPGVTPGLDLTGLGLHTVRETALGAHLDLGDGRVDRATAALEAVLANQHHAPGQPWDGTFRVTAEEGDPPADGAVEWLHYDPNWRQFLGCTLALVLVDHGDGLDPDLAGRLEASVLACVQGEPEGRIADWYTNPNLMHAWLTAWAGERTGAPSLVEAGEARARSIVARFDRLGDVDEYNSPTYDGVDLFALALWSAHPPTPAFALWGGRLLTAVADRVATLFHRPTRSMCGPYVRAYGLGLDRYVSLVGVWLALAGLPAAEVLPEVLDRRTVHVHDLYFAAVFAPLVPRVAPHLDVGSRTLPRAHEQHFGDVHAVSRLEATTALGAARGAIPAFARDQYVPLTLHRVDEASGAVEWVGLKFGPGTDRIDAAALTPAGTATASVSGAPGSERVGLQVVCSASPTVADRILRLDGITVEFDHRPEMYAIEHLADCVVATFEWDRGHIGLALSS